MTYLSTYTYLSLSTRAVEDVVPALLVRLKVPLKGHPAPHQDPGPPSSTPTDELALLGLQGLVSTRARDMLEYLVDPTLHTSGGQGQHGQVTHTYTPLDGPTDL